MNDYVSRRFASERHAGFQREVDRDALVAMAKSASGAGAVTIRSWPTRILISLWATARLALHD